MKKKRTALYGTILGLLLFLGYLALVFPRERKNTAYAEVLLLGDSIFGAYREETSVNDFLEQELHQTVFNGAFGGTPMALQNTENNPAYYMDAFTFAMLSRALAYGDFGVQQTVRTKEYPISHFPAVIDEMEKLDYEKVQTVLLCYGLNDYMLGVPLDNARDPMDETTLAGAMRSGITRLREKNPSVRIVVVGSPYCWFLNTADTCEERDFGGGKLEVYVEKEAEVAAQLGVEYVDLYDSLYPHDRIEDALLYTEDGMHPNLEIRQKLAKKLAERIRS